MLDYWSTPVPLTGRYVRLEPLTEAHVPGLAAVGLDPVIWRYMLYGEMTSEAHIRAWVQDMLNRAAAGTDMPFAVIHLASGQVCGATRYIEMRPLQKGLEIGGTWYGVEFQRTVVNTESKYLLMQHAFEDMGCIRVQFKADSRNERSLKAIQRLGAKKEGVFRNHYLLADGLRRDSVFFSIIDTEWEDVKKDLEEKLQY